MTTSRDCSNKKEEEEKKRSVNNRYFLHKLLCKYTRETRACRYIKSVPQLHGTHAVITKYCTQISRRVLYTRLGEREKKK